MVLIVDAPFPTSYAMTEHLCFQGLVSINILCRRVERRMQESIRNREHFDGTEDIWTGIAAKCVYVPAEAHHSSYF